MWHMTNQGIWQMCFKFLILLAYSNADTFPFLLNHAVFNPSMLLSELSNTKLKRLCPCLSVRSIRTPAVCKYAAKYRSVVLYSVLGVSVFIWIYPFVRVLKLGMRVTSGYSSGYGIRGSPNDDPLKGHTQVRTTEAETFCRN